MERKKKRRKITSTTTKKENGHKNSKDISGTFPGDPVVKNPPANAGDSSSLMVQEDATCRGAIKPACVTQLLSLCA